VIGRWRESLWNEPERDEAKKEGGVPAIQREEGVCLLCALAQNSICSNIYITPYIAFYLAATGVGRYSHRYAAGPLTDFASNPEDPTTSQYVPAMYLCHVSSPSSLTSYTQGALNAGFRVQG
jgi:hypothetical protein